MADEGEKGWEPWEPAQDRGDSGVGAFRGGKHPDAPGDHGLGKGRKLDTARDPPRPVFPPEGWGEEGENDPPTQGPLADPGDSGGD